MTTSLHRGTCLLNTTCLPSRKQSGFSMSELVVVISILGVLASIATPAFNQFLGGSKDALAATRQEALNQAVYRFAQQNYELVFGSNDASVSDELVILRTLQYRNPNINMAMIGSPYYDPRYNPVSSSDNTQYRLRWTGKIYDLLMPGTNGTGLLVNFEGSDFTTAFVFPPNFQMAGR